jgi:hypothetical protein
MAERTFFDCHLPFINDISHNECSLLSAFGNCAKCVLPALARAFPIVNEFKWRNIDIENFSHITFPVLIHVSRDQCLNGSESWPCSAFDTGAINFHLRHPIPIGFQIAKQKNREALSPLKGFSEDGGVGELFENLHAYPFDKDLSNESSFSQIHLARQYL